jgi:uncharacterized protein YidB (DUF937 family)
MGLLDILNGMQNAPGGQRQPQKSGGGGMSPLTMALLALLAYKALKGRKQQPAAAGTDRPPTLPTGQSANAGGEGGGLGDILGGLFGGKAGSAAAAKPGTSLDDLIPGGLGGLLGGAAAGTVLSGGLGNLIKDLEANGHGRAAQSWIGTGENHEIAPHDLANALGGDTLNMLTQQTGMNRQELLEGLSQNLPDLVDQLTPHGRLPTEHEATQMV